MPRPKDLVDEEGSVYRDGDGWRAALVIDGRTVRRRAKSERAAHAKLRELLKQRDQGLAVGTGKMKLSAWYPVWLTLGDRKPMTNVGHRESGDRYILPYLGERSLEELRPHHLDEWKAQLRARNLGAWTINGAFRRLRACLNVAVKRGMIARNVCKQVDAPPPGPRRTNVLNPEQQARLLAELESHRLYAAFAVAGTLGLRPAELLGLRVGALLLDAEIPALIVREQLQYLIGDDGRHTAHRERSTKAGSEQNPKARVIPLSLELAAILRAHLTMLKAERLARGERPVDLGPDDLLFVTEAGTPIGDRNLLGILHRACKRAGVPRVSLHALRHTAGSTMLARGEQIVDVAAVLGHANPLTTASIYAHSFDEGKRSAVNAASATLLRRA